MKTKNLMITKRSEVSERREPYNNIDSENINILPVMEDKVFIDALIPYGKKRILFITIKDNTPSARLTIGKVNDWIRRFSNTFFIVKSPVGGAHYHIFCGIEKDKILSTLRGIHFHIQDMTKVRENRIYPDQMELDSRAENRHYRAIRHENIIRKYNINLCIPDIIKQYWDNINNQIRLKEDRITRKTLKHNNASQMERVMTYMYKNLYESSEQRMFKEYIHKYVKYVPPKKVKCLITSI